MSPAARNLVAILLIVTGIAFLCFGILRGELDTVFRKAINVCLECIGIG